MTNTVIKPPYNIFVAPKGFTPYPLSGMAELSEEELEWEYEVEWLKYSSDTFPDHTKYFNDFNDFVFKVKTAPLFWLRNKELSELQRSTCLSYMFHNDVDKKIQKVKNDHGHRRDVAAIVASIKNNTVTPPIVIQTTGKERILHLISGNTRMCVSAALNYILPVKLIKVNV